VQDTDRKAFDEILGEIFAAIDKPLGESQRSAFWKALTDLSLLELARIRDHLLREGREHEPPRKFTPGDIWRTRKALRAAAPTKQTDDGWRGDDWDQRANLRLLSRVMRAALARRAYGAEQLRSMAAFKNHWADLMRTAALDGEPPIADQDDCWRECMRMADEAMTQERAA
jgi:hypothetical protein